MKTNNNIPAYRFQGYTDAWELRRIFEIADRFDNLRIPIASSLRVPGSTPYYGANGIQDYVEGYTHDGEFVLVAEDGANDLKNYPVNLVNGKIWVNNHAHVLQGKENIANNNFLSYSINRANIEVLLVGGGRAKLNSDVLMDIELEIPSLPEQEVIGTFFSTLDRHITLHQRKLDTLKEQKKTYLKLLFPSKGQTKPALRFQGFEDDWEEVKLGEVLSVSKLKNKENEYSKLNVLSVSREQGTVNQIEYQGRSFASDDVSGYKIVNVGQMIYTKSPLKGAPYGIFQTVTINGIVSPLYAVYNSSGRALASFVSLILKEDAIATHYLSPLVTKGAKNTINVTDEGALEGKVKIPTLPEQQAIGTFFQTLDREISQVEDKLASLKELKKTLLRKLFV